MSKRIATVAACAALLAGFGFEPQLVGNAAGHANPALESSLAPTATRNQLNKGTSEIATLSTLPSLPRGGPSEALAVDEAGTVIVGYSWDHYGLLHGVKWTLNNGSWTIKALPLPLEATSSIARGVNNQGDAAGNDFPASRSHAILWPAAGGSAVLGCNDDVGPATVYAISADGQIVVGQEHLTNGGSVAALWQSAGCRTDLPSLVDGGSAIASAVDGHGTIAGGSAAPSLSNPGSVPVRWISVGGQWQIEPLDGRPGGVRGANSVGDLAGSVTVPYGVGCPPQDGCSRAAIWYVTGDSRELGTLGGAHSWARDINASGEVVGSSTSPQIGNTAYFWSESLAMFQLPVKGQWAAANAVSDVRPDGTRLVVGMSSQGVGLVWVVRNP